MSGERRAKGGESGWPKCEVCTKHNVFSDAHQVRLSVGRWILAVGVIAYQWHPSPERVALWRVTRRRQCYVQDRLHECWQIGCDVFAVAIARRVRA